MRAVVVQMGVTLDGFVHGAHGYEEWRLPPEDDDMGNAERLRSRLR